MSYDPSHRKPPRQERWPSATPAEGWPYYRDGDGYQDGEQAARQGTATWPQAGHQRASGGSGDRGYPSSIATDTLPPGRNGYRNADYGYGTRNGYDSADYGYGTGNGHGSAHSGYRTASGYGTGNGYGSADYGYDTGNRNGPGGYTSGGYGGINGYAGAPDNLAEGTADYAGTANGYDSAGSGYTGTGNGYSGTVDGYPGTGNGYGGTVDGYAAVGNGYGGTVDSYSNARNGYAGTIEGYPGTAADFGGAADGFDGTGDGYGYADDGYGRATGEYTSDADGYGYGWNENGYGRTADEFADPGGYLDDLGPGSYTEYNEAAYGDPRLTAPDVGVYPGNWQAEQDVRREARQRGMMIGVVTVFLGIAVAIGVSTFAAALLRAQTSPVAALGDVFTDRMPTALRNAVIQHFGGHGRTVLLLVAIAILAVAAGLMARRGAALGVAGIAAFTLFAAFAVITRPGSQVSDVTPVVIGGIAGVAALLWLVRASAPIVPLRHAPGGGRRRAR